MEKGNCNKCLVNSTCKTKICDEFQILESYFYEKSDLYLYRLMSYAKKMNKQYFVTLDDGTSIYITSDFVNFGYIKK